MEENDPENKVRKLISILENELREKELHAQ